MDTVNALASLSGDGISRSLRQQRDYNRVRGRTLDDVLASSSSKHRESSLLKIPITNIFDSTTSLDKDVHVLYIYPLTLCQKTFLLSQNLEIDTKNVIVHQRFLFFIFLVLCVPR
jgi:hypothetical protein